MATSELRLGGVPEHFNLPWLLALESGQLDDMKVSWQDQPGGTGQMLQKLASGELDVVSILTEGTVKAIADGLECIIIQVYVESPLQWGVFVPAASSFAEETELAYARIAISRHSSGSHLMAYIQAERMGWTPSPDRFVVVGDLDGAVAAFDAGDADLFLWDQFMTRPLVQAGRFRQLGVQPTPWPSFVIAARREVLLSRTTEVGRVVDAVVDHAAGLEHRDDRIELVSSRYDLDTDTAKAWFASTRFAPRSAMDPAIAPNILDTLSRAGFG